MECLWTARQLWAWLPFSNTLYLLQGGSVVHIWRYKLSMGSGFHKHHLSSWQPPLGGGWDFKPRVYHTLYIVMVLCINSSGF